MSWVRVSAAHEMARVLVFLAEPECVYCGATDGDPCNELITGHRAGCIIGAALERAGVLDYWPAGEIPDFGPHEAARVERIRNALRPPALRKKDR